MNPDPQLLQRLSPLLDQALDLEPAQRAQWLASLPPEVQDLAPVLHSLLMREAARETADILEKRPDLTGLDAHGGHSGHAPDDLVGAYRLVRSLGQGGMGEVWLAERTDGHLKRSVALKLPVVSLHKRVLLQRFERERDILSRLSHPHIARLYDAGVAADDQPYLAMEYVQGKPITRYCDDAGLTAAARVRLVLQVMDAVQYAHANLVIHRDLKPANVLVTDEGKAFLLDFGIAKLLDEEQGEAGETALTRLGGRALTLEYAAPEQLSGAPVSTATDVYALGVVLYELLSRRRPFNGSRPEVERAILEAEPERPADLPAELVTVLLRALKKNPAERYATVNSFAVDLENWLQGKPVSALPDSAAYRLRKFVGRHRLAVGSAVVVTSALVAATTFSVWQASIAQRESQVAAAVENFLQGIFNANSSSQSDPERARRTTARELLDIGARRIALELKDAPQAKLRVLDRLARMYEDLTLAEPALALLQQQVALLRQTESADSVALASALTRVGSLAAQTNALEESKRAFEEAERIFRMRGENASVARGVLDMKRAGALEDQGDRHQALQYARRAVAILRRFPPSAELLSAMQTLSDAASDLGGLAESIALIQEGLRLVPQVPDLSAHQQVELHLELARLLNQDYQITAAERSMRDAHALALAREGPDSHMTLNAALELGNQFFNNGEYVQALAAFGPAAASSKRALAGHDRTWMLLLLVGYEGATRMRLGEVDAGLRTLKEALSARDILDANAPTDVFLRLLAAEGNALRGERAAAQAELDAAQKVLVNSGMKNNNRDSKELIFAALRCAVVRADGVAARQSIAAAKLDVAEPAEGPNARLRRLVRLAEAQLVAGDAATAQATARQLIDMLPQSTAPGYDGDRERRAWLVTGKAQVRQGQAAAAVSSLRRAVALASGRLDTATSPMHADALTALGLALAQSGQRDEARPLAAKAKDILASHERLDEALTRPLAALQARL